MTASALSSPFSTATTDELTLRDVESLGAFLYARLEELKTATTKFADLPPASGSS